MDGQDVCRASNRVGAVLVLNKRKNVLRIANSAELKFLDFQDVQKWFRVPEKIRAECEVVSNELLDAKRNHK